MQTEVKRSISRESRSHERLFNFHVSPQTRTLPLVCPTCQNPISLASGLCGHRQIRAILLQSQRIGAELECGSCGLRFVLQRSMKSNPAKTTFSFQELSQLEVEPESAEV